LLTASALLLAASAIVAEPRFALAQEHAPGSATADPKGKAKAAMAAKPVLPDADKIVLLVRTTLITVNDAVQTGNYTVLRDKAAPAFRDGTTPAGLMQTFTALTNQRIDLSPVAIIAPQRTELPALDKESRLRLKGYFPGQPVGIAFDMTFEAVAGSWRAYTLSVELAKMPAPSQAAAPQAQRQPAAKDAAVPKAWAKAPKQTSAESAETKAAAPR
jgi:hypothetical protein